MKIQGKTLIIYPHDFDRIMGYGYDDDPCQLEVFKDGLKEELFMNGLDDTEFDEIKLVVKARG